MCRILPEAAYIEAICRPTIGLSPLSLIFNNFTSSVSSLVWPTPQMATPTSATLPTGCSSFDFPGFDFTVDYDFGGT